MFHHLLKKFRKPAGIAAAASIGIGLSCTLADSPARLLPVPALDAPLATTGGKQTIVLAGGCFWGVEAVFRHIKGVEEAVSGYAGGSAETAQYDIVSTGRTGHAESVRVTYDPAQITPGKLLQVFFAVAHDPTTRDRQGPDSGTQYRSAIFFTTEEQGKIARAYIAQLDKAGAFTAPIVTATEPLTQFYPAEAYHQDYAARHPDNPYIAIHDLPKVVRLKETFPDLYKE